jgi:hypothetical protein
MSRQTFEQLVSVRGESDEWDFKATPGDLAITSARVDLAKDLRPVIDAAEHGVLGAINLVISGLG